ncbi:MAG: phosphoribosylanthranilate isomerase [SAR202 cluster bacterium]|nr:phosphoribosylanthranilate isomerase [SAR202 cluster bacterium]
MTNVKICGLRTLSDATIAIQEGADFIGFVFVQNVTRQINVSTAKKIIKQTKKLLQPDAQLKFVGLFVNEQIDQINQIINECELDYVQLCGNETPTQWKSLNTNVIKQLKIPPSIAEELTIDEEMIIRDAEMIYSSGAKILIDADVQGKHGGTGVLSDWDLASKISAKYPVILAGGLTPRNVSNAIQVVNPWGVDVSSGVESNSQKDPEKIAQFIKNSKTLIE